MQRWLKDPSNEPALRALRVVAKVEQVSDDPPGWRLSLSFESPEGTEHQSLVAERCETLADIVALDVALAVDPKLVSSGRSTPNRGSLTGAREPTWVFGARAAGGVAAGVLPGVAPGLSISGSATWSLLRLEIGGAFFPSRSAHYTDPQGVGARFDWLAAVLRACVVPAVGSVEFPLCAGVEGGDLRAEGFGVAETATAHRLYGGLALGPAVAIPLFSTVYLWGEAQGALAVARPSFRMRNLDELYRPGVFSGRAFAGLEMRFR